MKKIFHHTFIDCLCSLPAHVEEMAAFGEKKKIYFKDEIIDIIGLKKENQRKRKRKIIYCEHELFFILFF